MCYTKIDCGAGIPGFSLDGGKPKDGLQHAGTLLGVVEHAASLIFLSEAKDESPADGERIGPFIVIKPLSESLSLAHDPALRRRVWIVRGTDFQRVSEARRDVARPGRLRWLGGTAEWDAFEAPGGQSLLAFEKASQPWATVRWWLADLAEEIATAEKDGTLPKRFDLDQIWINSAGRAGARFSRSARRCNSGAWE